MKFFALAFLAAFFHSASGLTAELPADLAQVLAKFQEMVVPADEQGEKTFLLRHHQDNHRHALLRMIKEELSDKQTDPDFILEEFLVKRDTYGAKLDAFVLKNLFQSGPAKPPFFCTALKGNPMGDRDAAAFCREKISRLWNVMKKSGADITYVRINGHSWGEFAEAAIILRSQIKDDHFLRVGFDLVHEI